MTTNTDRAAEVLRSTNVIRPHRGMDAKASAVFAQALADAGLLMPDLTIIRTVEELHAIDPDTLLMSRKGYIADAVDNIRIPAVVVATAAQVRAARKALEEA